MRSLEGKTIGFYYLLSLLGQGSSADVYMAQDLKADRVVACKIVAGDQEWGLAALRQEWDILSMLNHPGIPRPLEQMHTAYGEMLVMTLMPGITPCEIRPEDWVEDWKKKSIRARHLSWEILVMGWGIQICEILMYLHERRDPLIYGDLKPANLRLNRDGQLALVDLGTVCFQSMAELRKAEGCLFGGTPGYAAPEQYEGEEGYPVAETDLYALGILLGEWLNLCWGIRISEPLRKILSGCTAQKVDARWRSAREVCCLLQAWMKVRKGELLICEAYQRHLCRDQ